MATVANMTVTIDSLDFTLKSALAEYIYDSINNLYGRIGVSTEEFKAALDSGMRDTAISLIRNTYKFVDNLDIQIIDSEYYDLLLYMYT